MEPVAPCVRAGPERLPLKLADVLRAAAAVAERPALSAHQWKILNVLLACQSPQLGGHRYRCEDCGREHFVPRSCGNRHCPNCQWHQAVLYNLLFWAASQTLLAFGRNNLGAQLGLTLVLHTWSQTLLDHYHVHCIVTGGGLTLNTADWKATEEGFLFPVIALAQVFQGKFCQQLQQLYAEGKLQFHGQLSGLAQTPAFQSLVRQATSKTWNVYVKRPFAGPEQVLRYLSRYTHRVAISQRRLRSLNTAAGTVEFTYKIRRDPAPPVWSTMELDLPEFLRRFCLHILPERFVKIRHYGLLANRGRQERVAQARALLSAGAANQSGPSEPTGPPPADSAKGTGGPPRLVCPYCGQRALVWIQTVNGPTRAPPYSS